MTRYPIKKVEADTLRRLDTKDFKRLDLFCCTNETNYYWYDSQTNKRTSTIHISVSKEDMSVCLTYSFYDQTVSYVVHIISTKCHFGGCRYWFVCASPYCARKVRNLYLLDGYFKCNKCHNLTYRQRNRSKRSLRHYITILGKLWDADELNSKLKKRFYAGKPTRQYAKVLRLTKLSERGYLFMKNTLKRFEKVT